MYVLYCIFQTFYTPENHPKSKPYFDHVINFGLTPDKRVWIRFYAVNGKVDAEPEEIGIIIITIIFYL